MDRKVVVGIVLGLAVIALAVGIGVNAYQAGVARGLAEQSLGVGQVAPRPDLPPYAYYGPYWHRPWGFGFGFLFPLLFIFLIFALLRGLFWRPWGWHGGFEEWHRRAHESMPDRPQKA